MLQAAAEYFLLLILKELDLISEVTLLSNEVMLLKHQLVHLTLGIFTEGQLPIPSLHMRVKFVSFLFDDHLSLKKLGVIVEKCAFQSGSLDLHGVKLLLS